MMEYYFFFVYLQRIIHLTDDDYEKNATIHCLWSAGAARCGA